MKINKLTERLLAEGWTQDQTPPGCKSWNQWYGGWQYDYRSRIGTVFETPCGLLYKREELSHSGYMSYMGVDWTEENDCMTVLCPHYDRDRPCPLNHPLLQESVAGCRGEGLHFCAVHQSDKEWSADKSAQAVIDAQNAEMERRWEEFSRKRNGRVCRHQSKYNRRTKEWSIHYWPEECVYGCTYCSILKKPIDNSKKGKVFYDEIRRIRIEGEGLLPDEVKTVIHKGIPLFEKPRPLAICEAIAKYGLPMVKWRLHMANHSLLYFHKNLSIEWVNFRAEKTAGRDLLQDLEDVANGITVIHEADKRKQNATAKKQRRTEATAKRVKSAEKKIRNGFLDTATKYERKRMEKLLGEDRVMELEAEAAVRRKETQITFEDLMEV